jgi:hypothetical protein
MMGELDLYGVFVPDLAAWMLVAFVLSFLVRRGLACVGFDRFVWHRPLFDPALTVVLLGLAIWVGGRLVP